MTTKAELLKVIRQQCGECFGGERNAWPVTNPSDIESCTSPLCSLFPYRFGKDPSPSKNKSMIAKKRRANGNTGFKRKNENRRSPLTEYQPTDQKEIDENLDIFLVPD